MQRYYDYLFYTIEVFESDIGGKRKNQGYDFEIYILDFLNYKL